jgi:hypothetical protein
MLPEKVQVPLQLPPAALSASGVRVEGLPSSQPVTQAPLLICRKNYSTLLSILQVISIKASGFSAQFQPHNL